MAPRKTTTSSAVKRRWNEANYTRLVVFLPKEDAAEYKRRCAELGKPMSDIPKEAIYQFLKGE